MKDKRNILKIACLLEVVYVVVMMVYYLFYVKSKEVVIASTFMLLIGLIFAIVLYNESKKDIDFLKQNKSKIILCSIWLFLEPIIPGILGFIFLGLISDKKREKLPDVKDEENSVKSKIKAVLLILFFILIMFVFPNFNFFNKISVYVIYLVIFLVILIINYKSLNVHFKVFVKNFKTYVPFIIRRYFIMLGVMLLVGIPVVLLNNGNTSSNQAALNAMFEKVPLFTLILSTLYAPFAEENIFRLSLSKLFKNKTIFIIISGLLFGTLHMIDKFTSFYDLLYIFQYAALGICLAKAYVDSKNIMVPISMHFIQNFIAAILVLILY